MSSMPWRFSSAVRTENNRGFAAVIPDIKCISPKEGDLLQGRDPVDTAKELVNIGAPVLSVVTESKRFGGSPKLLADIAKNTNVPVLRKDFITDENQLFETLKLGAAAVLLICAITDEKNLCMLYEKSLKIGLEPFVEVCTPEEMTLAKKLGAKLIGINNRNILTLELDNGNASRTAAIASGMDIPKNSVLISESGILSPDDAKLAVSSGANAVLVGTALWKARDMGEMYKSLRVKLKTKVKICGLMREDDVRMCVIHGTDIIGFVVDYPHPVPWNINAQRAKELISVVSKSCETCIVTSGDIDKVLELALEIQPDYVQLHGRENIRDTAYLVNELAKHNIKIIKTVFPDTPDLEKTAADFCKAGVYALLFDPRTPDNAANGGTVVLSEFINLKNAVSCPVILAGGINPGNVKRMTENTSAQIIDLMTGVEKSSGVKDEEKVIMLFKALRE